MAGFLDAFMAITAGEDVALKVIISLVILVLGHLGVKLFQRLGRRTLIHGHDLNRKEIEQRNETIQYIGYILDAGVILLSLLYVNASITSEITTDFVNFLPQLVTVILIGILGFITINLLTKIGTGFLKRIGAKSYFREIGLSGKTVDVVAGFVKGFLYLLLLQIALKQIGIGNTFINELVTASSWALAFLVAGLIFYGFKDLFRNFAAGVYLQNSRLVRPGEEVRMEEETGEIRDISLFSTTVNTETGYTVLKPNTSIMDSEIKFKRTKNDIETLEEIKSYFVAQETEFDGAASMEMMLDMFGFRHRQQEIAEAADQNGAIKNADLIQAVETLTNDSVKGAFVGRDKITELDDEFKAWFNNGALVVPVIDKTELFPEATEGEYLLSVGVEEDEALLIDPSVQTAGVYFVDTKALTDAMVEDKHGYIVAAPKGTTAYWRIKNDLIYSDKNYYDELSKTLEARLTKILRQGRILQDVMPSSVRNYMEDWRTDQGVSHLWRPEEGEEDETSEDN